MERDELTPLEKKHTPEQIKSELAKIVKEGKKSKYARFILAVLGSIPWVGGFLSAIAARDGEKEQGKINQLHQLWIEEHEEKVQQLGYAFMQIFSRFASFDEGVQKRIESPNYLALVKKGFRSWDQADTSEKRELIRKLIINAAAIKLCPDDLVRLFIDWIDRYHEAHFKVIREIYKNSGINRGLIWDNIRGTRPRENSAEADLYKLLIRDLSTGGVIRQDRATTAAGEFLKRQTTRPAKGMGSRTMESAFEETKPYVLTELGKQFVHYTMEEVVPKLNN